MSRNVPGTLFDDVLEADGTADSQPYSPRQRTSIVSFRVEAEGAGTLEAFTPSPLPGENPISLATATTLSAGGAIVTLTDVVVPELFVRLTDTSSSVNRIVVEVWDNGE